MLNIMPNYDDERDVDYKYSWTNAFLRIPKLQKKKKSMFIKKWLY
jgi:hypothetical protein